MRPTYTLADIFEAPSRARVLHVLARAKAPMSIRSIARAAHISHTAAGSTLKDLDAMGLTSSTAVGRAHVYQLHRENAYVRHMVLPAVEAEQAIVRELRSDLVRRFGEPADSLILFGSYATGDQDEASDIDVFALVPDERGKQLLEEVAAEHFSYFSETYGAPLSLLVYTRAEVGQHLTEGQNPFRTELESTGIILHGTGVSEWGIDESEGKDSGGGEEPRQKAARQG
ncbi:MAG: nucleotidyltransferase domain-containing protein [Coriobacteriia bacterium]|nr:nucleotidyltransferase domain-containing protein [Coriobacteriia bacterium]